MGDMVEFRSNGDTAQGYLATASEGAGPGILVIQEWWGLIDQIKGVCDELSKEGFTALAPDLYRGEVAGHTEMDKANELMQSLPMDRAARDMAGAVEYLLGHPEVRGRKVGVVGFCMGGMLSLVIGAQQGDKVGAVVSYYGAPLQDPPDWSGLTASVMAHVAESDDFFPVDAMRHLEEELNDRDRDVTFHYYSGAGHAFANEEDRIGTYHAEHARQAWVRTLEFLRAKLG